MWTVSKTRAAGNITYCCNWSPIPVNC